ncbi:porin [Sporomusa sp. GT1]|uniref:porin n=1 Tax=Sporomusa TaxID=2375 RepID=UPI0016630FF7|nr:porin [Sporomusa sp. GT1]
MKKTVATSLAAVMLLSAGTAAAASFPEFQFNGDVKLHYRWNTEEGKDDTDGGKLWFRLNAASEVAKNLTFYTRLTTQHLSGDNVGADFDQKHYHDDHATSLDRIGLILKGKDFDYTLGRQDLFLGQGLLMDSTGYMGKNMGAIDGLTARGKTGVTNLTFVAGQAWMDGDEAKVYAVDASYSPAKDWKLGATVAGVTDRTAGDDSTHYGINAAYTAGKATYFGEYGKSDADSNNKGYALGASYDLDKKNSLFTAYSRVEGNTDILDGMTTYDNGGKGMYYGFSHKIDADTTLNLFYKDMKAISTNADYTSFRTTVTYKF